MVCGISTPARARVTGNAPRFSHGMRSPVKRLLFVTGSLLALTENARAYSVGPGLRPRGGRGPLASGAAIQAPARMAFSPETAPGSLMPLVSVSAGSQVGSRRSGARAFESCIRPGRGSDAARRCVLFDIDNCLVDVRYRTREAVNRVAREEGRNDLIGLPVSAMRYNGKQTAAALGLDAGMAAKLRRRWNKVFWSPRSLKLDRGIPETMELAKQAAGAGFDVFYLTGRDSQMQRATVRQLRRLGLPGVSPRSVVCKPDKPRHDTPRFKGAVVSWLRRLGYHVGAFVSDSRADIAEAQRRLPVERCFLVDFPVGPGGPAPRIAPGTPVIRIDGDRLPASD